MDDIVNDAAVEITTRTEGYSPEESVSYVEEGELILERLGSFEDRKFIDAT